MPSSTTTKKRSGNPSKRAAQDLQESVSGDRYAPKAWGSGGGTVTIDLECPSGQLCLVRRPGVEGLMKAGILHHLDALTPLVEKHAAKAKGKRPVEVDTNEIMKDPEKAAEIFHMMDRVVVHCVVKPEIAMAPNDPTSREAGVIYTDMVDLEDKMFILNYVVGGSTDLERFRRESEDALGGVLAAEEDEGPTE